jgi:hypothetical protein
MNILTFVFLASPTLGGFGEAILDRLYLTTLLPLFLVNAIHGHEVELGIFQALTLISAEIIQWRLIQHSPFLVRVLGGVVTYVVVNFLFFAALGSVFGVSPFPLAD